MNKYYIYLLLTLVFNISAGFLAKFAVWNSEQIKYAYALMAVSFFAFGFLFYMLALKKIPLYLAQSIASLQFISLILLSSFFFKEEITTYQWVGIFMIFTGIVFVAKNA